MAPAPAAVVAGACTLDVEPLHSDHTGSQHHFPLLGYKSLILGFPMTLPIPLWTLGLPRGAHTLVGRRYYWFYYTVNSSDPGAYWIS